MKIDAYGQRILDLAREVTGTSPSETPLGRAGHTVCQMVQAYGQDGILFLRNRDPINAVASFGYAYGWLEAGVFLGLLCIELPCDRSRFEDRVDPVMLARLSEKAERYQRLLREGISALEPAPDKESILRRGSDDILLQARTALNEGDLHLAGGEYLEALGWYGYGHGWLDAGVRIGLFRITGRRDLFTV
ncbi:MAG: DUF357 domain-containing protein [Methanomicrobiales archaeon]|nr:DUF357 domain-containing protein [Methanomicrobiales archaeon]